MKKSELIATVKSFLYRVRIAESNRLLYQQFCDYGKDYNEGINLTPAFWTIVTRALVHNMMIELSKIYDKRKDSIGIKKLISICDNNYCLFGSIAFIKKIEADLGKYDSIICNLRNQRNKIWAHNNCEYFLKPIKVEELYELSWEDIEVLIELAKNIGNKILTELGETAEAVTYSNIDDILLIFETMQDRATK